ncbi:MAG TPA: hypothetical protein VKX49_14915 [Bryobacteraceae bacterium]|nr:hypothetical protein [Bryobacteraceae bacterium]
MKTFFVCSLLGLISVAVGPAQTLLTPTTASAPDGIAPNGIGATTGELLFSEPYCTSTGQPRGIYSVTSISGTSASVVETTPLPETTNCAENYLYISPGLGGFTAGDVYAAGWNSANTAGEIYKNGSAFVPIPGPYYGHAGVTFDTIGTFKFALIVTTTSGVFGYDSMGNSIFSYPLSSQLAGSYVLESATVAPLSNPACPGCLYITAESLIAANGGANPPPGVIFVVRPNTAGGTQITTVWATTPYLEPENVLFINSQSCTFDGYSYFVSIYAMDGQIRQGSNTNSGAILAFTPAQLTAARGQFLIAFEDGHITTYDGASSFTNFYTNTNYQFEGATTVACPAATGCPATQGFWKNHGFPSNLFNAQGQVSIAGVNYTAGQLHTILDTAPKGGDAALILMHQLIAALANIAAGAQITGVTELGMNVSTAITDAESLLQFGLSQPGFPGSNPAGVTFPINFNSSSGNFVQSSTTLGGYFTTLANVLDAYNSAQGLNCQEGSGLTSGSNIHQK